jgi:hypothetical protein
MVAGVYCAWGLYTRAYFFERRGLPAEAERSYLARAERYDSEQAVSYPLLGFYYRMARVRKASEFEPRFEEFLSRIFPQGLELLPEALDPAPPTDGVLIDGDSDSLRNAGLRGADVVVGLDGFRVRTLDQYDAVRNLQPLPSDVRAMKLRVWRQTQYHDIEADLIHRRFGVRVRTYGTPGPSFENR